VMISRSSRLNELTFRPSGTFGDFSS